MNTDCSKCKAAMSQPKKSSLSGMFSAATFTITGYRCAHCGHWNNLKRRKGYKA